MTWLITGGAGYIGAHVVRAMTTANEHVVVLDDLSAGVADRLPADVPLVAGSSLDATLLKRVLSEHAVTGIVHLAARKQVGESVAEPARYYQENVGGLATLLDAAAGAGVERFVFSSSAAVYGNPDVDLITEDAPCAPVNPYGETKLAGEWLVRAAGRAHGMATTCLRYFNVAGAAEPPWRTPACTTSSRWSWTASPGARPRASSAMTTPPRTAPVSVTTFMWRTSPRPTSPRPGGCPRRPRRAI